MNHQNLRLQDDPFAPAAPDTLEHLPSHHCAVTPAAAPDIKARLRAYIANDGGWSAGLKTDDITEAADRIEALERQLAEASKDAELMDIIRTLVCTADRMSLPNSENYPSPLSHFSPLMIAARQACIDRGFTAGGLSINAAMKGQK